MQTLHESHPSMIGRSPWPPGAREEQIRMPSLPLGKFIFSYVRGKEGNTTNPTKFLPLHFVGKFFA